MNRRQAIGLLLETFGAVGVGPHIARGAMRRPARERRVIALEPLEVDFPLEAIDDLNRRLDSFRWRDMPFDTGWSAGTNDRVLRELVETCGTPFREMTF